jgi:hypothetical protein
MKIKIVILIVLTAGITGYSQVQSVRDTFYNRLSQYAESNNWNIDSTANQVIIFRIDTFSVCSYFNPIRSHKKIDTLFISFNFNELWSKERIDSSESYNYKIISPLTPKYIAYYDSIGWGKARIKKEQLLSQPKTSILQDWNKDNYLASGERSMLFKLVRLPDTLINGVAVIHRKNFPPMYLIEPKELSNALTKLINYIDKTLLHSSTILRNEGFYITRKKQYPTKPKLH